MIVYVRSQIVHLIIISTIFVYCWVCIKIVNHKRSKFVILKLTNLSEYKLAQVCIIYAVSILCNILAVNNASAMGMYLDLLSILFKYIGLGIFIVYICKDRGITLAFPLLLLRYGNEGAKSFLEKKYSKSGK